MTIKALYPSIRPSLDLNFARTRALDPRITFTRPSTGTFVGSDGLIQTAASGVPRFDFNPTTGESLGLLVEEARTNLIFPSDDFANTAWFKASVTISSESIAGPSGVRSYAKLTLNTFTGSWGLAICSTGTRVSGSIYASTVYAKQGTARYLGLGVQFSNSATAWKYFDLQTGTAYAGNTVSTDGTSITAAGNGWWRISAAVADVGPGASSSLRLMPMTIANPPVDGSGTRSYDGNGEFVYVHAAQAELGSFPTSYIPTSGTALTRSADAASIDGANFNSWYNQGSGSVVVNVISPPGTRASNGVNMLGIYPNAGPWGGNLIGQNTDSTGLWYGYDSSSVGIIQTISLNPNGDKVAWGLTAGASSSITINNLLKGSYTWSSTTRTSFFFAYDNAGSARWKRITYYPTRFSDAQLAVLTQ